jgi:hypothetical protein
MGHGTPPLHVAHPTVDYMYRPDQDVWRFGRRIQINELGMRSGPMPEDGRDLVLVIGDSIIYGGWAIDQSDLAVVQASDETTYYANISAGSWGPGNQRAYLEAFGPFGADAAIFVVNPEDPVDVAQFLPLSTDRFPTENPVSALTEAVIRHGPKLLPNWLEPWVLPSTEGPPRPPGPPQNPPPEDFAAMLQDFGAAGVPACVVLHPFAHEFTEGEDPGRMLMRALALAHGVPVEDLLPPLVAAGGPAKLYRDPLHLNAAGQAVLREAILRCRARAAVPVTDAAPATSPIAPR